MARVVKFNETGPKEIKTASGDSVWCCMCGISNNKPLCDGSHKKTKDEHPHKTYAYEGDKRVEI